MPAQIALRYRLWAGILRPIFTWLFTCNTTQDVAPNITPYTQEDLLVEQSLLNCRDERIENKPLLDRPYYQAWKAGEFTL